MSWKRAGDLGLWAALGLLVLAESGARGDSYWLRAAYLAILAAAVLLRRAYPLVALALVGAGLSNAEIAGRLYLVEVTVKAYVSAVLTRLGVKNRVQAAIVAYEAGLVTG